MIEINNLTTSQVNEDFLRKIAVKVLKGEKKEDSSFSLAITGQGRIRELNKRYRKKNRVTDVLAFPESRVLLEKFKMGPIQKVKNLGEILICLREIRKNAKKYESTFERELARVLIHGILHLLGYDHEKGEDKEKKMKEKEEYYLNQISFN